MARPRGQVLVQLPIHRQGARGLGTEGERGGRQDQEGLRIPQQPPLRARSRERPEGIGAPWHRRRGTEVAAGPRHKGHRQEDRVQVEVCPGSARFRRGSLALLRYHSRPFGSKRLPYLSMKTMSSIGFLFFLPRTFRRGYPNPRTADISSSGGMAKSPRISFCLTPVKSRETTPKFHAASSMSWSARPPSMV